MVASESLDVLVREPDDVLDDEVERADVVSAGASPTTRLERGPMPV
jgi:hypothetical protein